MLDNFHMKTISESSYDDFNISACDSHKIGFFTVDERSKVKMFSTFPNVLGEIMPWMFEFLILKEWRWQNYADYDLKFIEQ